MSKNLRIVFMGTPEFAVASLGSLLMNGQNVVGVVTTPDKPAGRGRKLSQSAVKQFAEFSRLPLLQPENLRDSLFLDALNKMAPDLVVVVAFRFLPPEVWKIPPKGTINLHASLLPQYRGAAPINHVLINGEHTTGVTTFMIDDDIDTGNILLREEVPVFAGENAGDLHNRLMRTGALLVNRTVDAIEAGTVMPVPQSNFLKPGETIKTAPKIFPHNCVINWNSDVLSIHNLVRGLSPYPCARSAFRKGNEIITFKLFETQAESREHDLSPGEIDSDNKHFLRIACKGGFLNIISLQLAGRKRMSAIELLRGFRAGDYSITDPVS